MEPEEPSTYTLSNVYDDIFFHIITFLSSPSYHVLARCSKEFRQRLLINDCYIATIHLDRTLCEAVNLKMYCRLCTLTLHTGLPTEMFEEQFPAFPMLRTLTLLFMSPRHWKSFNLISSSLSRSTNVETLVIEYLNRRFCTPKHLQIWICDILRRDWPGLYTLMCPGTSTRERYANDHMNWGPPGQIHVDDPSFCFPDENPFPQLRETALPLIALPETVNVQRPQPMSLDAYILKTCCQSLHSLTIYRLTDSMWRAVNVSTVSFPNLVKLSIYSSVLEDIVVQMVPLIAVKASNLVDFCIDFDQCPAGFGDYAEQYYDFIFWLFQNRAMELFVPFIWSEEGGHETKRQLQCIADGLTTSTVNTQHPLVLVFPDAVQLRDQYEGDGCWDSIGRIVRSLRSQNREFMLYLGIGGKMANDEDTDYRWPTVEEIVKSLRDTEVVVELRETMQFAIIKSAGVASPQDEDDIELLNRGMWKL